MLDPDPPASARSGAPQVEGLPTVAALPFDPHGVMAGWDPALVAAATLIQLSSSPMALMVGRRGVLWTNPATDRLFAEEAGALNGRSVLEVLPGITPFYAAVLRQALAGEAPHHEQQPIKLHHHGTPRTHWFNLDFTPIRNAHGTVVGVLGVASNVSALVRRNKALSESEQRLRLALESSGMVGVWALDLGTQTISADAHVAHLYGLNADVGHAGVPMLQVLAGIHPSDRHEASMALQRAITDGTPYRHRYRLHHNAQGVRWVIASGKPVRDDDGRICRLLGVVVDVSDQMEIASALAESRFQFQTLTETLPQIVWSCDAEGRHDYFSARWTEYTGIAPEDITEDTWKTLVDPDHHEMVFSTWERARQAGEPYDLDYRFRHHSGEYRWLRVMALPIRDSEGRITRWFGTSTDVHDAYRLTAERETLARDLMRIATEDQLTRALTRRAFFDQSSACLQATANSEATHSLLMIDIDHFKRINDQHGHPVGDRVLAATAQRIMASVRDRDVVGRIGGEEFAVFLPRCTQEQALDIAERMRVAVEHNAVPLDDQHSLHITLSIGCVSAPAASTTIDPLLSRADHALYDAKAAGRNRIRLAAA